MDSELIAERESLYQQRVCLMAEKELQADEITRLKVEAQSRTCELKALVKEVSIKTKDYEGVKAELIKIEKENNGKRSADEAGDDYVFQESVPRKSQRKRATPKDVREGDCNQQ